MPHMANLPWNISYFLIFICLFFMMSKIYFIPMKLKNSSEIFNNLKILQLNNWKW